jgi:acyl dehydratase
MPLEYDYLMSLPPLEAKHTVLPRDVILYALGVGVGAQAPTDPGELQYLLEDRLKVLPSFASVMAYPGFWAREPKYGLVWQKILAAEQSIELHGPLPVSGEFDSGTVIDAIYDKGPDKGALIYSSRAIRDRSSGRLVATVRQAGFARADGGFGGSSEGAPKPTPVPSRAPNQRAHARTREDQALIYRLSGDYNPLHADPEVALSGGFSRPIFHGLGTFGVTARALLKTVCNDESERVHRIDARYSRPVYPGDELAIDIWEFGSEGRVAFQVSVPAREVIVLQNGVMEFEV